MEAVGVGGAGSVCPPGVGGPLLAPAMAAGALTTMMLNTSPAAPSTTAEAFALNVFFTATNPLGTCEQRQTAA